MSRKYSEEFKKQIVAMYNSGKPPGEILKEYEVSTSSLYKWISRYNKSGSFELKDNLSEEQKKLRELEKENKQLRMENDILKQAALIMGRKSS
jgi:Transposase and inactivated derivatives